jgi:hypothetical protein
VVVLILAGAAFIGLRGDSRRKQLIFWISALIVSVLWSLGSATPFYHIPYALIPGTKYFRAPATIFFVGTLAIGVLACAGTERFLQLRISRKYMVGWLIFGGVIAVLASVGALTSIAESFASERTFDRVQANRGDLFLGAWRSFAFVVMLFAIWYAFTRNRISARLTACAVAILLAADLWSIERLYWLFSPPAKTIYASDAIVDFLKREQQPVRVLAFAVRPTRDPDPFLSEDALMSHGIRQVLGYHGNQLGRYNELVGFNSEDNRLFSPNVLALTNTGYFLTDIPELPFIGNATRVKGPVVNAAGDTTYLYRVNQDNPYSWVTPVAVKAPDDQVLATVLNPRFDVKRAALFDTSADVAGARAIQALPAPLSIATSVRSYAPGSVKIDLSAPAPAGASLIVSENYYPGWLASVDGKPARLGRADYSLIGVELPTGARSVELNFTSPAYQRGKIVTWIAILIGVVMLAAGTWSDRRRLA